MSIEFEDEKGKLFTEVVTKIPVRATVQTTTHQLIGNIHVRPDQRLKDELNEGDPFIAVTDAYILDADGKTVLQTNFLAIRRDQIVWVMPNEGKQ